MRLNNKSRIDVNDFPVQLVPSVQAAAPWFTSLRALSIVSDATKHNSYAAVVTLHFFNNAARISASSWSH